MLTLRNLRWPDDREALCALNTSFTTGQIYKVVTTDTSFILQDSTVSPALHKDYHLADDVEGIPALDYVVIAEYDAQVVGVAALINNAGDRRAIIRHFYIDRAYRRQGIGQALMEAVVARARQWQTWCLWLETQDVNYAAIQFYKRSGFQWCGLDLSLDEPDDSPTKETAVFFMRVLK